MDIKDLIVTNRFGKTRRLEAHKVKFGNGNMCKDSTCECGPSPLGNADIASTRRELEWAKHREAATQGRFLEPEIVDEQGDDGWKTVGNARRGGKQQVSHSPPSSKLKALKI